MYFEIRISDSKKLLHLLDSGVIEISSLSTIEPKDLRRMEKKGKFIPTATLEIYNRQVQSRLNDKYFGIDYHFCDYLNKENLKHRFKVTVDDVSNEVFKGLSPKYMGNPPQGVTPLEVINPKDIETLKGSNQFRSWLNTREDWTAWFGFQREFKPIEMYPTLEGMRSWVETSVGVFVSLSREYGYFGYKHRGLDRHLIYLGVNKKKANNLYKTFLVSNLSVLDKLRGMINDLETKKQRLRFEVGDKEGYYLYNVPKIKKFTHREYQYEYVCKITKNIKENELSVIDDFEYSSPLNDMGISRGYVTKIKPSRQFVLGDFEKITKHLDNLGCLWTTTKERSGEYLVVLNESVELAKGFFNKALALYKEAEEQTKNEVIQKLQSEWDSLNKIDNIKGVAFWSEDRREARIHPTIKDGGFEYTLNIYDYYDREFTAEYIYEKAYEFYKSYEFEKLKAAWDFEQKK